MTIQPLGSEELQTICGGRKISPPWIMPPPCITLPNPSTPKPKPGWTRPWLDALASHDPRP